MIAADGEMLDVEKQMVAKEAELFGVAPDSLNAFVLETEANALEPIEAIRVVSKLSDSEKKYVCGYLASLMTVDGDIDNEEIALWRFISTLADFPTMSIHDAIAFWSQH